MTNRQLINRFNEDLNYLLWRADIHRMCSEEILSRFSELTDTYIALGLSQDNLDRLGGIERVRSRSG